VEVYVDIQSVTTEIRRGKKEEKDENIMSASATQGGHNKTLTVKETCSWLLPWLGGGIVTTTTIASLVALYLGQPG